LLLITNKASEEQRKEIIQIVYGQTKGDCFALFAAQFVDINAKMMEEKELCTRITRGGIFSNTRN
jgi:hypothetical protein